MLSGPNDITRSRTDVAWERENVNSLVIGRTEIITNYFLSATGSNTASMM